MVGKIPRSVLALFAMAVVFVVGAASASASTIYNNIPSPVPGNVVSQAFEATQTSQFGGQVEFAGTARMNPKVTVLMSTWGCQEGSGTSCHTTNGATFPEEITLNINEVGAGEEPGALVGSLTQTFNIPYRPSANNKKCTGGRWSKGGECFNGKATKITFDLMGVKLPQKAILSVAYSTSDYGSAPKRPAPCNTYNPSRCGYDSLNVGLTEPANEESPEPVNPAVGSDPLPNYAYINSKWAAEYGSEPHGTVGTFSLANEWTGYQPLFKVSASAK
ncbi:MAG TPA: hypothetical protein VL988_09930 [Solirubrobacteraceae bacterium]|nr:hypothetical protein [Solirubrobacteraceae bacterium]